MGHIRVRVRPAARWSRDIVDVAGRRMAFAVGRFAGRVRSVTVRLADINGPRGGADKQCQVSVRLTHPRRLIVVEDVDVNEVTVISRAAERLSRAVARAVREASRWREIPRGYD